MQRRIAGLSENLAVVDSAEAECNLANVEENDYTVFTCQDLKFELELLVSSVAKKIAFIDNQVLDIFRCHSKPSIYERPHLRLSRVT
jgi:hypothetical protein